MEALGEIGDVRAIQPLIAVLADADYWVRRSTAEALKRLGDDRYIDIVKGDCDDFVRLTKRGERIFIKRFISLLDHKRHSARVAAAFGLIEFQRTHPNEEIINDAIKINMLSQHKDRKTSRENTENCTHSDYHSDTGIGLSIDDF